MSCKNENGSSFSFLSLFFSNARCSAAVNKKFCEPVSDSPFFIDGRLTFFPAPSPGLYLDLAGLDSNSEPELTSTSMAPEYESSESLGAMKSSSAEATDLLALLEEALVFVALI